MRLRKRIAMPSNQVLEHVAANLRRLRDGQGLSQQALADAAGVSRHHRRPGGRRHISLAKLSLIATALGANFTALVSPAGRAPDQAPDVLTWRGQRRPGGVHCSAAASHQVTMVLDLARRAHQPSRPGRLRRDALRDRGRADASWPDRSGSYLRGDRLSPARSYAYANRQAGVLRFIRNLVI